MKKTQCSDAADALQHHRFFNGYPVQDGTSTAGVRFADGIVVTCLCSGCICWVGGHCEVCSSELLRSRRFTVEYKSLPTKLDGRGCSLRVWESSQIKPNQAKSGRTTH